MQKNINGVMLKKMISVGFACLDEKKDYVDSLNVFPVPDGDTGINMASTLRSVIREVEGAPSNELPIIAQAVSRGGLKGARGNSGVILSQILKGMMAELAKPVDTQVVGKMARKVANAITGNESSGKPLTDVTTKHFARALDNGSKVAYSAVTVPKEGTILTVIRVMAEESKKIARSEADFVEFFKKLLAVGENILAQTPEMLPVLKKAGVVDSGGRGLLIFFGGMLSALDGTIEVAHNFESDGKLSTGGIDGEGIEEIDIEFAYCTEFNITNMNKKTTMAAVDMLREKYVRMGDSVVCVGDLEMLKVHIHTNDPGEAITAALQLGEIINLKVDNMLQQSRDLFAARDIEMKDQGIVAVAAGEGIVTVFKDLGVDFVIRGGQTMNPSAEDIAKACDRVHAKTVFVFPNNKNIILAARHAQDLCKKNLIIIPTKSVNEGIAACIAFASEASIEENTESFHTAATAVKSGSVTYAVRSTKLDRFSIKEGEVLGLDSKTVVAKGANIPDVTTKVVEKLVDKESTSVMLFYGEGIKEKDANALHDKLMAKYPELDISIIDGGQPVYYYLISVE
ncbi:MAG: DAK2 domain-containing protein [Firmicutes bacterium]|nr:DAK2 domain-containing protein [Bacillota bacterium]